MGDDFCTICRDYPNGKPILETPCGHVFHVCCMTELFASCNTEDHHAVCPYVSSCVPFTPGRTGASHLLHFFWFQCRAKIHMCSMPGCGVTARTRWMIFYHLLTQHDVHLLPLYPCRHEDCFYFGLSKIARNQQEKDFHPDDMDIPILYTTDSELELLDPLGI